jgi:hypothetical protein
MGKRCGRLLGVAAAAVVLAAAPARALAEVAVNPAEAEAASPLGPFLCYATRATPGRSCALGSPRSGEKCKRREDCGLPADFPFEACAPVRLPHGLRTSVDDPLARSLTIAAVLGGATLCDPAEVAGQGSAQAGAQLRGLRVSEWGRTTADDPFAVYRGLELTTALGSATLDTKAVDRLLLPAVLGPEPAPLPEVPLVDAFRCAPVKPSAGAPRWRRLRGVSVVDRFGRSSRYDLWKPSRLCLASGVGGDFPVLHPQDLLLCFRARAAAGSPRTAPLAGLWAVHPLGSEQLDVVGAQELCLPAARAR